MVFSALCLIFDDPSKAMNSIILDTNTRLWAGHLFRLEVGGRRVSRDKIRASQVINHQELRGSPSSWDLYLSERHIAGLTFLLIGER